MNMILSSIVYELSGMFDENDELICQLGLGGIESCVD